MIPQDKNQPGPPGRITIWGHPWHGLVEDGVLTLPNAATMSYPAPSAGGEADVLAFAVPGTPAVSRDAAQTAADTAAGRQWLNYALISGHYARQLYGQNIGGNGSWLYAAPDGSRWLVTLAGVPNTHDLTTPWATTVTCVRFGEFGTDPETHVLNATLADWQQSIPGHPGGDYNVAGGGTITSAQVSVDDVRTDGSQAVLVIYSDASSPISGLQNPVRWRPLGFLTCTLSGTPGLDGAASLQVVRSRADTLGSRTLSTTGSLVQWHHHVTLGTWDEVGSDESDNLLADVGTPAGSGGIDGRILALVYTAGGTLAEVTLSTQFTWSMNAPMPPDGIATVSRTSSASSSGVITLSAPGGDVALTMSQTMTLLGVFVADDGFTPANLTTTRHEEIIIDSDAVTRDTVFVTTPSSGLLELPADNGTGFDFEPPDDGYAIDVRFLHPDTDPTTGINTAWFYFVTRYSATAFDLTLVLRETDGAAESLVEFRYLGAVGRGAALGALSYPAAHRYGSAHPITGEIARARDVPVCWV